MTHTEIFNQAYELGYRRFNRCGVILNKGKIFIDLTNEKVRICTKHETLFNGRDIDLETLKQII